MEVPPDGGMVPGLQARPVRDSTAAVPPVLGMPAAAVERAIAMSHEKYCSASIMLGKSAQITTSFELAEA